MSEAHTIALLSPLERSVLGALQQSGGTSTTSKEDPVQAPGGGSSTMELMARLYPGLEADCCRSEADAQQGLFKALAIVRCISVMHKRGLVHHLGEGRYCITVLGMARLEQCEKPSYAFGRTPRNLLAVVGAALALSACSIFMMPATEQGLQPTYAAQPMAKMFEMQQFRAANGILGFRMCSHDCEAPTPKTVGGPALAAGPAVEPNPVPVREAIVAQQSTVVPAPQAKSAAKPASHYRLYFRFGAAEFGPEAIAAIKAAIPELREMERIEVSAGTDPIGTSEQNAKQIALRQVAVKTVLVAAGIKPESIILVQNHSATHGLTIRGMPPRPTKHAEMRQANLVGFR